MLQPPHIPSNWRVSWNHFDTPKTPKELWVHEGSILRIAQGDYLIDFGNYTNIKGRYHAIVISIGSFGDDNSIENTQFTDIHQALHRLNHCIKVLEDPNAPIEDIHLKAMKIRCKNAQLGNWFASIEGRDHTSGSTMIMTGVKSLENIWDPNRGEDIYITDATTADIDFIAHARQDIPRLLAEVDRLKRVVVDGK
jgi:hypothetical protein